MNEDERERETSYFSLRRSGPRFEPCPLLERLGLRLRELDLEERRRRSTETGEKSFSLVGGGGSGFFSWVSPRVNTDLGRLKVKDLLDFSLGVHDQICRWRSSERFPSIYASIERSFVRLCVCVNVPRQCELKTQTLNVVRQNFPNHRASV